MSRPEGYLEKFAFIADADDNRNHDRQFVAAMVNYLDDIVGNVASALEDAGLWSNTLLVWSSDNGAAVELTTGMKNSYPLRGGYYTNWVRVRRAVTILGHRPDEMLCEPCPTADLTLLCHNRTEVSEQMLS